VVFLSGSKSVCFLYVHSLTLLLYCLHVYVAIVYLWSFWVAVNLYVFYTSIHWPCYCTVYMFMLSLFICGLFEWTYKKHTDLLPLKKTTNKQWQHKHVDSTITGSVNGRIKNIQIYCHSKRPQKNNGNINSLCCHCLFVVFLSGSKSVCFLYVHSLTLLLYCLHVYVAIVFLLSFWVAVNLYDCHSKRPQINNDNINM
jgi:hypothetical protein